MPRAYEPRRYRRPSRLDTLINPTLYYKKSRRRYRPRPAPNYSTWRPGRYQRT